MARVTTSNFLHWYDNNIDQRLPPVPYPYHRDKERCVAPIIALPTEAQSFYINSADGFKFETFIDQFLFSDLRLGMYRLDGTLIAASLGPLQQHIVNNDTGAYNIFCTLVIPASRTGIHFYKIYHNPTGQVLLTSSNFMVRNNTAELYQTTTYARFRHDRFSYNIRYGTLPGFYQQFRLNMGLIDEQPDFDRESYFEVTTGKPRNFRSIMNMVPKVELRHLDRDGHEAAAVMFEHDFIELNNRRYSAKTAYKPSPQQFTKLSNGEVELYDYDFASLNRCI